MEEVRIRLAEEADVPQLIELRLRLADEVGVLQEETDENCRRVLHRYFERELPAGRFVAWVAEAEGQIVATSGMVFLRRPPSPHNPDGL